MLRRLAIGAAVSFGALTAALTLAPTMSRGADSRAFVTRSFSLNESGHLHLTSKHGFTLDERGSASGTVQGAIYVHMTVVSTDRVTAEVNIYPRGGSISGTGTASYVKGSTMASFSGSLSIGRGTGSYNRVHGSSLSFSGTIRRSDDAVTVRVRGTVSR
ncbi:MAG TPA: hypothetical protein VGG98_06805 [Solirubrobacteraceae bacterium]|jgi:hypothetical protein